MPHPVFKPPLWLSKARNFWTAEAWQFCATVRLHLPFLPPRIDLRPGGPQLTRLTRLKSRRAAISARLAAPAIC